MSEELALPSPQPSALSFVDGNRFDHIQRVAKMFSESQLVPTVFQKNVPNVVIALEMSQRMNASPLMVMQNLNVIHGKPSFGASFMIAAVNACGRFTPLRFVFDGKVGEDEWGCYALAKAKADGEVLKGTTVTIEMARAEGWVGKSGSKWKTMPELMLQYRAATFWTRAYAPDILMGFPTQDEAMDIYAEPARAAEPLRDATAPLPEKKKKGVAAAKAEPANVTRGKASDTTVASEPGTANVPPVAETHASNDFDSAHIPTDPHVIAPAGTMSTAEMAPKLDATRAGPTEPKEPAQPCASESVRCEIVSVEEKQAKKAGGTIGPVCTVTLKKAAVVEGKAEFQQFVAYYDGAAAALPRAGAVGDAMLTERTLKGATVKILNAFTVHA